MLSVSLSFFLLFHFSRCFLSVSFHLFFLSRIFLVPLPISPFSSSFTLLLFSSPPLSLPLSLPLSPCSPLTLTLNPVRLFALLVRPPPVNTAVGEVNNDLRHASSWFSPRMFFRRVSVLYDITFMSIFPKPLHSFPLPRYA